MKNNQPNNRHVFSQILRHLKPYGFLLVFSLLLSAAVVALTLYVPVLVGRAVDMIVGKGAVDFNGITKIAVTMGGAVAATALLQWLASVVNQRVAYHVVRDVRKEAFSHLQTLPLDYYDKRSAGEIVSRVIADAEQFADGLLLGFTQLFTGVLTIVGTLIFMLLLHPGITLVVVLLTPLSFVVAKAVSSRTYKMFRSQSELRGEQTALIDELISGQKVVKAFSQEQESVDRFNEVNERLENCSRRAIFFSSLTNPCTRFVNSIVYAGVAMAGALVCINTADSAAAFTVGALSSFLAYANQYTKPFNEISGVVTELQNALACAARVFSLIHELPELPDAPSAHRLSAVEGQVQLENVSFSYTQDKPLIRHVDLHVRPGMRVAIVGPTGCGKTTLINLLMRFYDVQDGAVYVDGHDIRTVTRQSLRESYGMVLQETWLKAGTIRENITMGKPNATEEEIISAAKAAHAHSFIDRLPKGYDTVIGEEGGTLSQGQKQLLCITRIMLCRPPMLILDEATSSIDTRTEIKIQEAFSELMKGRTTFIVAHRLSTIREADVILVMRDGNIVEQGSHQQLLAAGGFYAELYNSRLTENEQTD